MMQTDLGSSSTFPISNQYLSDYFCLFPTLFQLNSNFGVAHPESFSTANAAASDSSHDQILTPDEQAEPFDSPPSFDASYAPTALNPEGLETSRFGHSASGSEVEPGHNSTPQMTSGSSAGIEAGNRGDVSMGRGKRASEPSTSGGSDARPPKRHCVLRSLQPKPSVLTPEAGTETPKPAEKRNRTRLTSERRRERKCCISCRWRKIGVCILSLCITFGPDPVCLVSA